MHRLSTTAALALAILGTTGCLLPYDHYDAGMKALHVQKLPDAQGEFKQVPKNNFRYQEAQFELGVVFYMLHDLDHALQQMISARAINPEQFEKEQAMMKGLGLLHAEMTQRWNVKTEGVIEDVKAVGDVLLTVSKDGVVSAHRKDQLLWESPLGPRSNYGRAIPAVDGGLVYVVKEQRPSQLLALKLDTGEVAWSHDLGEQYEFSNVAVDAHAVYVGDGVRLTRSLLALDKRTGRQLWSAPIEGMPGSIVAAHDRVCTHTKENKIFCMSTDGRTKLIDYQLSGHVGQTQMVMTDQALFLSVDNSLYALRFSNAPLAWKQSIEEGGLSAASLVDGGKKLVVQTRNALRAYDAQTGNPLWLVSSPREDGEWNRTAMLPIELGGAVVGWGDTFVFGVSPEGRLLWQLAFDGSLSAAPVSVGDDTLVLAVRGHKPALVANTPRKLFD